MEGKSVQLLEGVRSLLLQFMGEDEGSAPEDCAQLLLLLRSIKDDLKIINNDVEQKFIKSMNAAGEVHLEGKRISVSGSAPKKTWQHSQLKNLILDRLVQLSIDDNGEVNLTPREAVDRLLEFAHVDYWRATALQELDINASLFCTIGEEKTSVRIEDQ